MSSKDKSIYPLLRLSLISFAFIFLEWNIPYTSYMIGASKYDWLLIRLVVAW
jgi:putative effector of murein hydrolase